MVVARRRDTSSGSTSDQEDGIRSTAESARQEQAAFAVSHRVRLVRRRMLINLRKQVIKLHDAGYSISAIAHTLGISPRDVRAFCPKPSKEILSVNRVEEVADERTKLTNRAIKTLLRGRHSALGGSTDEARARALPKIAAAYTMAELLEEPGIGHSTATQIELWLEHLGLHLRMDTDAAWLSKRTRKLLGR
ncbi:putative transcriptional regulator [Pseudochelatococcus lubricantis]|uniref:Transcriptional regulator n=1 Tax=Pseudochelatococcus lubricantis TaxID=1538102 RepID=A0ABX0V3X9_9HYPH|nr:hypothetical protein [Pseudochelatococcus lubricantis]NIJ59858.1 putative transcriptional regulator [Pseudochelatococcus lubricantis]